MNTQEIILNGDEHNQNNELDEITILRDFGLEEDEAQTYVGLARLGSSKASEISTFTKIERVRTYKILENLKNLGFATSTLSSPIKFSANDPETILKNIIIKQKQKIENLEKNSSKFLNILSKLKLHESEVETPKLTIVSNRNNIYDQIIKLIDETNDELHIVLAPSDLIRMYYTPVREAIKNATLRKVIIKLMTDDELESKREYIQRLGIKYFKITTLPTSGRLVCNKSQVLMSGNTSSYSNKNKSEESVMVTNSKDIVRNMQSLCKFLWETGKGIHIENKQNKKEHSQKQSTILVVDDDPDAVNIFSEYLEIKGISTVEGCTDAKKAIDVFKKIRPEAVFLDIMMPDFDGFYLLDEIRKIDPKTKVIMVTADMSAATKKKLQKVNPTDVIYKPYDIKQIMSCLEK
ncbi:response regulator [Candidatus Nitrosarchaeum limnium]|uniref:Response regulator receiver domain protein n=1 Tax=Candidatus Nitrosarchaeum limnium BG20 TaxID=859192 RepID=S2EVF4_9ARCH|nr:response regulator [Candidatus Nitrosarchaeum limnium]EPA06259.1 response regulator receiver domain protein [Candidatus Nitrosarchaeum limnium BG20]